MFDLRMALPAVQYSKSPTMRSKIGRAAVGRFCTKILYKLRLATLARGFALQANAVINERWALFFGKLGCWDIDKAVALFRAGLFQGHFALFAYVIKAIGS